MKKILGAVLFVSVLIFFAGAVLAASNSVKRDSDQEACIRNSVERTTKSAFDLFQASIIDSVAVKKASIKNALNEFYQGTKKALETKRAALEKAYSITDDKSRASAIKEANDAYNNDSQVKKTRVPYQTAIAATFDIYNNDFRLRQAKIPYNAAVELAQANAIQLCTDPSAFQIINDLFSKSASALANFFNQGR